MKKILLFFLLILLTVPFQIICAQKNESKDYFRSPVNFPITMAGSFGEIRRNHFHSGIDIRTGGAEGKPVYAIADGYVSRVNISGTGFGKALYVSHPNGYTSLYAHLQRYAGPIAAWVKSRQYSKESFTMDAEVPPGELKVKKGDLIAYSGNSGASGGPHVHFEIRDSKTQEIVDPLDFGFVKPDNSLPGITSVSIYPQDNRALINFSDHQVTLPVAGNAGIYSIKRQDTVKVTGNVIFGIATSDAADGGLKTGVNVIQLSVDGITVFSQDINRFAFAETRYVNSILDYPAFVLNKRKIQRSYIAPNNKLGVYSDVKNRGIVNFSDSKPHKIKYVVKDAFGHSSQLIFWVKSHPPPNTGARPGNGSEAVYGSDQKFTYKNDNQFIRDNLKFEVPKEAVYEDFPFIYQESASVRGSYSPVHHLHNKLTPLNTWCNLTIRCVNLPPKLTSKALIVSVLAGDKFSTVGGKWENGWVTTRIRDFGNYTVTVDTEPPVIKPVNIFKNKNIRKQSSIRMIISDNLAGIDSYRGTLNSKWILMEYDAKTRSLVYAFDDHIKTGKNQFVLTVTDAVGNTARYEAALIR
ncbi:MAG: M23 family metallopeptidase [Bacteroidetes bacterium]|nr:M23 family metallopeptidase [Bacteroidota bacterium]